VVVLCAQALQHEHIAGTGHQQHVSMGSFRLISRSPYGVQERWVICISACNCGG
jgi:hypothetical protein